MEQLSKAAASAVEALKAQPAILGLIILNCVFVVTVYVTVENLRVREHEEMMVILGKCLSAK